MGQFSEQPVAVWPDDAVGRGADHEALGRQPRSEYALKLAQLFSTQRVVSGRFPSRASFREIKRPVRVVDPAPSFFGHLVTRRRRADAAARGASRGAVRVRVLRREDEADLSAPRHLPHEPGDLGRMKPSPGAFFSQSSGAPAQVACALLSYTRERDRKQRRATKTAISSSLTSSSSTMACVATTAATARGPALGPRSMFGNNARQNGTTAAPLDGNNTARPRHRRARGGRRG